MTKTASPPFAIPVRLRTPDGTLAAMPARVAEAIRCPKCRAILERSATGWGCSRHLGHTKILFDATLQAAVEASLPETPDPFDRRKLAGRAFRLARQLVRFCMRKGIAVPVATIAAPPGVRDLPLLHLGNREGSIPDRDAKILARPPACVVTVGDLCAMATEPVDPAEPESVREALAEAARSCGVRPTHCPNVGAVVAEAIRAAAEGGAS